jgi:molybdenum cofactor cytidylyltransferase
MITALVLAAGASRRMGKPKMLLPWGSRTILGTVIGTLQAAGVEEILVVTGADHVGVEAVCKAHGVTAYFNAQHEQGEMLSSLQTGLVSAPSGTEAALITLGDQPQMEATTVRRVLSEYQAAPGVLIVPSYQMRRGHPWLLHRSLWEEVIQMRSPETPRDFLNRHASDIHYAVVESASVLSDLDTPDDYLASKPQGD